jgi:KDO2-lipid IV(A) lauroyltransferase
MAKMYRKISETLRDWIGVIAIWICSVLTPLLPLKTSYLIARALSSASLRLLKKQETTILSNLDAAFGDQMDEEKKAETARKMAANVFKGFFEGFYIASRFRKRVDSIITIEGKENLDQALSLGRGVIAITAHFGNFTLLGSAMAKENYPFYMVIRHPKSKPLAKLFQRFRDSSGQKTIATQPWRGSMKKILHCLRSNQIVCLIADEYKRRGGVDVDFFGQNSPTAAGPAVYSLRTGAAIVPIFIIRQEDDTHKIVIEPPLEFTFTGEQAEDIRLITSTFAERIEHYIRTYPAQWFLLNRKWKGAPRRKRHRRR